MLRREVLAARSPDMPRLRDAAWQFGLAALALTVVFYGVVLLCAASCDVEQDVKDVGAGIVEISYCEVETCGEVFLCTMADGTKNEWCWMDDSATELRDASGALSCIPTPRGGALGWPCLYCTKGRGANAYQGSFGCGGG